MPKSHLRLVGAPIAEEDAGGLYGVVTLPGARVWILHGRRIAEATPENAVERAMTSDDVDTLLAMGVIDQDCALRQLIRVSV